MRGGKRRNLRAHYVILGLVAFRLRAGRWHIAPQDQMKVTGPVATQQAGQQAGQRIFLYKTLHYNG